MADLGEGGGGHKKQGPGVKKSKKKMVRVDMTPMVDLGFILITFFVFTSTMSTPTAMNLFLPKDTEKDNEQTKTKESGTLTILLGNNRNVYYYEGILNTATGDNFVPTSFDDIRNVILKKKRTTNADDFMVVIKPGPESTMGSVVDVLDEMTINVVKRYALVDISDAELNFVKQGDEIQAGTTPGSTPQ